MADQDNQYDILIVDDSATTRAMIRRVIKIAGLPAADVYEAADGAAALTVLAGTHVGLVLADLNMPVMDGFELIRRMRSDDKLREIPIVVISAQPDPAKVEDLKQSGVNGYLPKPFTPESVRNLVAPLMKGAEL